MTVTLAYVGAAGGAGTTRLAVESGALLTLTGRDVAIVDAAYETQGLADYVDGGIDADVTALVTDGVSLDAVGYPVDVGTPGDLSLYPARAPFERLARAKTAGAAERLEKQIAAIALSNDVVVVDTPPVATNQSVAAVDAADRITAIAPDSERGVNALARLDGRLQDVGQQCDAVVATFADGDGHRCGRTRPGDGDDRANTVSVLSLPDRAVRPGRRGRHGSRTRHVPGRGIRDWRTTERAIGLLSVTAGSETGGKALPSRRVGSV